MRKIEERFVEAVQAKERLVERHQKELAELKSLSLRSKALPIYWPSKINCKNAYRSVQQAQMLDAFKRKADLQRRPKPVSKIKFTLRQLWIFTQRVPSGPIKGRFRNDLNDLKDRGLLERTEDGAGWQLSSQGLEMLAHD